MNAATHESVNADVARVLAHHARAVTVITTGAANPVGFCATSVAPVAVRPALLSFTVARTGRSWASIRTSPSVLVHLLAGDQEQLAIHFARPGRPRFDTVSWRPGPGGLPELDGVLACLTLVIEHRFAVDDHVLVVGRVVAARCNGDRRPLLHHDGRFIGVQAVTA